MLNEKRVKHMVKLASYENRHGEEDFKAGNFFKKDYISYNLLSSLVWITLGYFALIIILGMTYINEILEHLNTDNLIWMGAAIILIYIGLLVLYGKLSKSHYEKKYLESGKNVKEFLNNLETLEKMYEREDAE